MIKLSVRNGTLLALLTLTLVFSNRASAAAYRATPPRCTGAGPGINEAYVYTGQNYSGICYSLMLDTSGGDSWTSFDATTGFPNDQIQSVWVGNVTLVLFWNSLGNSDNGVPLNFPPGRFSANLGNWNRQASAARVQSFGFGQCGGPDKLSLYTDQNFSSLNDCIELTRREYFNDPVGLGFRNDTMTSWINNSDFDASFAGNCGPWPWSPCTTGLYTMAAHSSGANVGKFNDQLSGIDW